MFKIYHGCAMGFRDGTRISISEKCILATNNPFWKHTEDIQNKVETRSMLQKKKKCTWKYMEKYYNNLKSTS